MKEEIIFENNIIKLKHIDPSDHTLEFWLTDIAGFCKSIVEEIVYCNNLYIPKDQRRKSLGSKMLQDFIKEKIREDKLYVIIAGMSTYDHSEDEIISFTETQWLNLFDTLDKFYNKNKFININEMLDIYEFKQVYIYMNKPGVKVLQKIIDYKCNTK